METNKIPNNNLSIEHSGAELFLDNYEEIQAQKQADTTNLNDSETLLNSLKELTTKRIIKEDTERLPKIGLCSEVLFYTAMKKKGLFIEPSSLREDRRERFDFNVFGFKVDITAAYHIRSYIDKVSYTKSQLLLVPIVSPKYRKLINKLKRYPNRFTYAYEFIKDGSFDYDEFLKETIDINYLVLTLMENPCKKIKNIYGLRSEQFGKPCRRFINEQNNLLQCLSNFL